MCALYIYCIKSFLNVHYLMPIARVIKIDYIPAILELVFLFSFICTVVFDLDKVIYIFTKLDKKYNFNSNLKILSVSLRMDLRSLPPH